MKLSTSFPIKTRSFLFDSARRDKISHKVLSVKTRPRRTPKTWRLKTLNAAETSGENTGAKTCVNGEVPTIYCVRNGTSEKYPLKLRSV